MKRSTKIISSLLSLSIAGTGLFLGIANADMLDYDVESINKVDNLIEIVSEDIDSITIKKKNDEKFKVLMFTDLHLNRTKEENKVAIQYLVKNITEQKPDLVIFGGDTVSSGLSKRLTEEFAEVMEKLGVYWAAVLGNHDGEGVYTYSRKEIIDLYASYDYCLIRQGLDNIDGNGNFTINILNADNSLQEVFFLLDSGDYMSNETKKQYGITNKGQVYDGVKESQVKWYKDKNDAIEAEYGEFKSIAVLHIPPFECGDAENYEFLYGDKYEGVCQSGFNSGLVDAFIEKGSTKAVYFGHDHINDFGYMYKDILFSYIQSSGYGSYNMKSSKKAPENEWLQGCTLLTLNYDGTFEAERIFNHK